MAGSAGGGLFRTDGGVKAESGLDLSDPQISEAWQKVRSDDDPTTWLLLGYESKNKLTVAEAGSGGPAELQEKLTDEKIFFGGLRTKAGKFMAIMMSGEAAGGMARGRAAAHKNAAVNHLEGTAGEVCGGSVEEFMEKLKEVDF
mmetsp:Transcript_10202/g.17818  ORF Transcript_10202/g.17818 Transcript_10202/m.17818 type:complete len:144 (-) Transcript_10202:75-506(-)